MIVATAGHVDHGKSTLVRALTGMEPDRWAEERRRGMTIDLGYAWSGDLVFVDVPGHERFLGNALAGLGPTPAALVVVAADEGWREQTEEHVRALEMLGVELLVAVVTRCDRADPARAMRQIDDRLGIDAKAVSGVTGEGLSELREALATLKNDAPDHGRPRLWVDRVFSMPGAGTVVTGTLAGGQLKANDEVEVGGRRTTIRGLQSLKQPVDVARPGTRVAVALRGIEKREVRRGDALTYPGAYPGVSTVEVDLTHPGRLPREAMLHVGTAAVAVRVQGQGTRLRLARPLPLRPGDRGLLRNPGLLTGVVVEEQPVREPKVVVPPRVVTIGGVALPDAAAILATLPAPFAVRDARIALGTTRRVAVAILEALDTRGVTRREGDLRYVK